MAEWVQENWLLAVVALVVALLLAWWLFVASRRTRVEIARSDESSPAKRNQALIDAAPAAPPTELPPPAPMGLAGVGEIVQAAAEPVPPAQPAPVPATGDDLTRIKGLGPKIADQLATLGVTDAQLGRFQGRIRRDDWPGQAKLLAAGDIEAYEMTFGKL
jgi:predicted flap endonuclease-1-like 5' DNA nuclease